MARKLLLVVLLAVLGSLTALSQQETTNDALPPTPSKRFRHQPVARGDEAAEYAKWKSLTPEEKQAIVQKFRNQVLPLVKQQSRVTQQVKPIDEYVNTHWKELGEQKLSKSAQPVRAQSGREAVTVRRGNHRLTYPAQRINADCNVPAQGINAESSVFMTSALPECGPDDPRCCDIYDTCDILRNRPPTVTLSASPTSGTAPLAVTLTASASDPEGSYVETFWDFGDGQILDGVTSTNHTYNSAGLYTASFTATDDRGASTVRTVQIQVTGPPPPVGQDSDGDGIADSVESQVADLFKPYYRVSAAEQAGTSFGVMGDYVPETPIALHGPVPPYSYYRVKPMGFATSNGVQYGVLRIDYLTLWNRDNGLSVGAGCQASMSIAAGLAGFAFSELLPVLGSHDLDNERSLMLVWAPTSAYNTYNTNPFSYSAYYYYTAAHEGTLFDQSAAYSLDNWPAGTHPQVALATSKHGTYLGNPDGLPLAPPWMPAAAFATINSLYVNGWIDDWMYWSYQFAIGEAFYGCLVEHFSEGGENFNRYADIQTNVGEPEQPINGSHFILDPKVLEKLQ